MRKWWLASLLCFHGAATTALAEPCAEDAKVNLKTGANYGAADPEVLAENPSRSATEWNGLVSQHQAYLIYGPSSVCVVGRSADQGLIQIDVGNGLPLLWILPASVDTPTAASKTRS